jgi:hypothetical protein
MSGFDGTAFVICLGMLSAFVLGYFIGRRGGL